MTYLVTYLWTASPAHVLLNCLFVFIEIQPPPLWRKRLPIMKNKSKIEYQDIKTLPKTSFHFLFYLLFSFTFFSVRISKGLWICLYPSSSSFNSFSRNLSTWVVQMSVCSQPFHSTSSKEWGVEKTGTILQVIHVFIDSFFCIDYFENWRKMNSGYLVLLFILENSGLLMPRKAVLLSWNFLNRPAMVGRNFRK